MLKHKCAALLLRGCPVGVDDVRWAGNIIRISRYSNMPTLCTPLWAVRSFSKRARYDYWRPEHRKLLTYVGWTRYVRTFGTGRDATLGVRLLLHVISCWRQFAVLPAIMISLPMLVVYRGSDAMSVCFNVRVALDLR